MLYLIYWKQAIRISAWLRLIVFIAGYGLGLMPSMVVASESNFDSCLNFFANSRPPTVQYDESFKARALCFSSFAVLHSGTSHTPIFVAEHLNRETLIKASNIKRTNQFFADARLPQAERAELEDYQGSGFDRGHMAPARDMATDEAMAQSFSLANVVPQPMVNNRKIWAKIERDLRRFVMRSSGDIFVITGPIYQTNPPTIGIHHVWIPQHLFKLVYDSKNDLAWAYWLDNTDSAIPMPPISYEELVQKTGIKFFPWRYKPSEVVSK